MAYIKRAALIVTAALTGLCGTPLPAETYFQSGNALYARCTTDKSDRSYYQNDAFCMAYIVGVADEFELNRAVAKKDECVSSSVTMGQLRDVAQKYLQEHPETRNYGASILVTLALISAFNCK